MNYEHKQKVIKARKHIKNGQFQEAQDLMNELLLDGFEDAEILKDVGLLYSEMGKKDLAAVYIRQSFDLDKSYETLEILANANFEAGKFDLAAIQFEELVKAKPDPNFYMKSIDSYEKNDMYEEAIRVAKMFYYADGTATAHSKLIFMLITAGMEEESIDYANVMVEKYPNHPATYNMLGFLHECIYNDYDTAKKYFYKSAKRGFMGAYYNLAVCCKQSEDFVNAEKYFKKLISMDEDEQYDTNYSLGSVYMAQRKLRLGYKYYLKRASAKGVPESYKNRTWDGKPHPRGTLYVITEQGFGDNIQFARYLPLAAKYFKRVIHGTRKVLETLLKDSFEKYPNIEVVSTDEIVKYDRAALIMDLPYIMHDTYYNIPSPEPYLVHSEERKKLFRKNFSKMMILKSA